MLKLQSFGHLMQRADLEKTEDEMVGWHHQLNWHEFVQTPADSDGQGSVLLQSLGSQRVAHDWATEQQSELRHLHTDMGVLSYKAVACKNGSLGQVLNDHLTYPSPLLMLYPCTKRKKKKGKKTRLTDLLDFQLLGEGRKRSQIWPLLLLSVEIHSCKYQKYYRLCSDFLLW